MKKAILLLTLLSVLNSGCQSIHWKKMKYIDESGKETEKGFLRQEVKGSFSNSVTVNGECTFVLIENFLDYPSVEIRIYPYSRNVSERWVKNSHALCKIKDPSGATHNVSAVAFRKGILVFIDGNYKKLKETLAMQGEYSFFCVVKGAYVQSRYLFKFKM